MTAADLHAQFGQPRAIFAAEAQAYITPAEYQNLRVRHGLYWEVFSRKTARNEYRILIAFTADTSRSKLHPTARIDEVRFEVDKEMEPEALVKDIAEARVLCANACVMHAPAIISGGSSFATTPDNKTRFVFDSDYVSMCDNEELEAIESRN